MAIANVLHGTPTAFVRPNVLRLENPRFSTDFLATCLAVGAVDPDDLTRAKEAARTSFQSPEDHLCAQDQTAEGRLLDAAQKFFGLTRLRAPTADLTLLQRFGVAWFRTHGVIPVARSSQGVVLATARPWATAEIAQQCPSGMGKLRFVIASADEIALALDGTVRAKLLRHAEQTIDAEESCRGWQVGALRRRAQAALVVLLALFVAAPSAVFVGLTLIAFAVMLANTALKGLALAMQVSLRRRADFTRHGSEIAEYPVISILVPLYHESAIAERLVRRLDALDWPRAHLDVILVTEADDLVTRATLAATQLPSYMREIRVPPGRVRTKPRAMNYALPLAKGSIIGIYDAEDAPERDQLHKVAESFRRADPDVACLQGKLDFYNTGASWITRCFTIDYAAWFRVILPGLARMGLVLPLGGTTLFFRRDALESLGGWDAHNVTEDADLGLRLARKGWRCQILDSTTHEEATDNPVAWTRQRSRWLKGYAMTWASHMRAPGRLLAELGLKRFLGIQVLMLGTLLHVLLAPMLWLAWILPAALNPLGGLYSGPLGSGLLALFLTCELVNLTLAAVALAPTGRLRLLLWYPLTLPYFAMATVAGWRGVAEIFTRPYHWEKTDHGAAP